MRDAIARGAGVILPVGATEQHSYHLPLATDTLLAMELARAVAEPLDLLVAPPLSYGYRSRPLSGGGEAFPGTLSLSGDGFMTVVKEVLVALLRDGFQRLVVLNWHYENVNFVYEAALLAHDSVGRDGSRILVHEDLGRDPSPELVRALFPSGFPGWDVEHAAVYETSVMLHIHPELVRMDQAVDDEVPRRTNYDVIPPPEDFIARSGTLWRATEASASKGRLCWDELASRLLADIAADLPRPA